MLALLGAGAAAQDWLDDWSWSGANTLRLEVYDNGGDPAGRFHPHEGLQFHDELSASFSRRVSPYEQVRGSFLGLFNESEYRSTEEGLLVERAAVTWEKGDAALPFRVDAGDFYGYLSYRTLQRPLKGAQLELQPLTAGRVRHSLLVFAGVDAPGWRDFDAGADRYAGLSWLARDRVLGAVGLNLVHGSRDASAGFDDRDHTVASVLGELNRRWLGQALTLEGELAVFHGDTDTPGAAGRDRSDTGWFVQLSGSNASPFSYRFRHERYGEHYQPAGASVPADRAAYEAHGTWRFGSGLRLRGRLTRFVDGLESGNSTDTDTAGLQLTGPVAGLASGALDAFVQSAERADGLVDRRTRAVSLNVSAALAAGWTGRVGASIRSTEDELTGAGQVSRELRLGADHRVVLGGWSGVVSPNLTARAIRGGTAASDDFGPGLALALERGAHALDLDYGLLVRDRANGDDVVDHRLSGRYGWTRGRHRLGLELDFNARDPDALGASRGLRVGASWTWSFDRPALRVAAAGAALPGAAGPAPVSVPAGALDVAAVVPGAELADVRARIAAAGYGEGLAGPGLVVHEAPLLDAVDLRQRLVVEHEAGRVRRAALVIDFDDPADTPGALRDLDRVRRVLLERYGPPAASYERGDIDEDLVDAVNDGRVLRVLEWETPQGRLRFGIPRRLDGAVRMELQHATGFPSPRETLWSVDALR